MRSDVAVTGREQWIVGTGRLLREYVYAGGIDGAVVKCVGKVLFVDERAASGIDEDGGGLHQSEPFCIYHLAGGVGEGTVQTDDVTFAEQLVQLHLADFGRKLEVGLGGVGTYLHTEADGDAGGGKTGVAQAYDTNFLSAQFDEWSVPETEVFACRPASAAHFFGVVLHLLGDIQDVGKDHLGYGVGAVGGNIGDNDAAFFGSGGVYDVVSGSQHTDVFQFGQCRHVLGGEHGFVGQQDFCTSGAFQYFRRGGAVVDGALAQGLQFVPAKVTGVGGIAV